MARCEPKTSYYNLMSAGQSWIGNGRIGLPLFMVLLHGGILLAALGWLALRQRDWRGRERPRTPAPADDWAAPPRP